MMRAEHLPQLLVPSLTDEVQVDVTERRPVPVRVVERDHGAVGVPGFDLVAGDGLGHTRFEQPRVVHLLRLHTIHRDGDTPRPPDPHAPPLMTEKTSWFPSLAPTNA